VPARASGFKSPFGHSYGGSIYVEITRVNLKDALSLIREIPDFPEPGILFRDITPLLADAQGFSLVVDELLTFNSTRAQFAGIEARGFIFASAMASRSASGFIPIRKSGKLPAMVYSEKYALEYGEATLEIHRDALSSSKKVVLVDDVLATGGTMEAAIKLVHQAGGEVIGAVALLEISALGGRERLIGNFPQIKIDALVSA
jgi:adenine phosphoribosyltransferase